MITRETIDKIIELIKKQSIKDSELPEVVGNLLGTEWITVIQDGINKKIPVNALEHILHETPLDYKVTNVLPKKLNDNTLYILCEDPNKCTQSDELYMSDQQGRPIQLMKKAIDDIIKLQQKTFPLKVTSYLSSAQTVYYSKTKSYVGKIYYSTSIDGVSVTADKITVEYDGFTDVFTKLSTSGTLTLTNKVGSENANKTNTYFYITIEKEGSVPVKVSLKVNYAYDRYCAKFAIGQKLDEAFITSTKAITLSASKSATFKGILNNEKVFYAYPDYLGSLTSVTDGKNDLSGTFGLSKPKETINIGGVVYRLYYMGTQTTTKNEYTIYFN